MSNQAPLWEQHWPSFATALCEKLARGAREYGDGSFERSPSELLGEIQEELLDVCGWAFVMLVRLKALENRELQHMNEAIDKECLD
jgi:hypothetical protein